MKKLLVLLIIIVLVGFSIAVWWSNGLGPVDAANKKQEIFVIQKGSGIREIASSLKKRDLIKDPTVFFLLIKQLRLDGKIQAGDFRLSQSMTAQQIAEALTHGSLDIWITIPEGKRAEEIADVLEEKMPTYKPSWRNILVQNEGYLFPDTYLLPKDTTIELIVQIMKDNFDKKFASIETNNNNLTNRDIVIIGSMVEREARFPQDRPLVASVIINRKTIGMKLDIDATVQYALGYQRDKKTWWKKELTQEDLAIDSPYNTYTHPGLPPTPISNPGLDVLRAVINSSSTDYFYYFTDKMGKNHYAKSLVEQNANIKKYGL